MNLVKFLNPMVGLTGLMALALSATIAFAEVREKMRIKVMTEDGVSEAVTIENLKAGESEVFVTESGKEVLVTRGEEQLTLEVGGRLIEVKLPKIDSLHEHEHGQLERRVFIVDDGDVQSVHGDNVWADKSGEVIVLNGDAGKHVIIEKEIHGDLSEEEIAELMEGVEMDIEIDGDGTHDHEVIMIKKRVVVEAEEDQN